MQTWILKRGAYDRLLFVLVWTTPPPPPPPFGKSGLFNVFYRLLARLLIHALLVNSLINPLVLANSRTRLPIPTKILLAVSTASE